MDNDKLLQSYIPLVNFLGDALGSDCEVALHDIRNAEHSLIAIKNNTVSGRQIGSPLTDLALKILTESAYTDKNFITKYSGKTKEGKPICSSTFFIKNENKKIIGLLCLNFNVNKLLETRKVFDEMIFNFFGIEQNELKENDQISENLNIPIDELVMSIIQNVLSEMGIPAERMSTDEKMNAVNKLNEKGVFLIKGAIAEVAKQFKTSENTIYRYLNKKE